MNPFPEHIRKIGIPSPGGIPDRDRLEKSRKLIHSWGIKTVLGKHVYDKGEEKYFSSDFQTRAHDFNELIRDPSIDLIFCSRGGCGSAQILPLIDWNTLRERKLPVLGYSDITAILMGMLANQSGIPVATLIASELYEYRENCLTMESMRTALHSIGGNTVPQKTKLKEINPGSAEGKIIPANLSVLASLCGSQFLPDFRNSILILEDVGDLPRIVDRHITQLQLSGILKHLSALVFGYFTDCGTEEEILRIIRRTAKYADVPVYAGLPFGHEQPSLSFLCGQHAKIENGILYF